MKKIFSILTTLLMAVSLCGVVPSVSVGAIESDALYYNGHYYKIFEKGMIWDEAKAYCESIGGHLATITSDAEQMVVNRLLIKANRNSYWLGAERNIDGEFLWITGEVFCYYNFAKNQPDNYMNENALMVYRNENPLATSALGQWNDLNKNGTCYDESFFGLENFGFICEWESSNDYEKHITTKPTKVKSVTTARVGKKAKVTWKKTSGASGYQVKYSTGKKFKASKTKTKFTTKTSVILKKLSKKKKYYVKVRAYKTVNGKKLYGKWSRVKVVRR